MKKRILASLLAVLLVSVCFSGCGKKKETSVSGEKTFSYWIEMDPASVTFIKNMNEVRLYEDLEKKTGVHIEFIHPPAGQAAEKFNLLIASREFPDVIEYNWKNYQGGGSKAVADGIALPITDLARKYAPNFITQIEATEEIAKAAKTRDGEYWCFPMIQGNRGDVYGGLYLRKDWLEELNLEVPETIDEWETVLRAFKEKKGSLAPLSLQKGHFITASGCPHFTAAYGVGEGYYIDDNGKVCYGPAMDAYKDYLTTMNRWYEEGLLDKEFATISGAAAGARMLEHKSGASWGFLGSALTKYLDAWRAQGDEKSDFVAANWPVLKKGDRPQYFSKVQRVSHPHAVITTAASNPEMIVEWFDYFYTYEGVLSSTFGVEGETYVMKDNEAIYTDYVMRNPDGLSKFEVLSQVGRPSNFAGTTLRALKDMDPSIVLTSTPYAYESLTNALEEWSKYSEEDFVHTLPPLEYLPEEGEERSALHLDMNSYAEEMILRFIIGEEPLDKFDEFQKSLNDLGLSRILEIMQDAYDIYNNN